MQHLVVNMHGIPKLKTLAGPDMGLLQSAWWTAMHHGLTELIAVGLRMTLEAVVQCDTLEHCNKPNKGLGQGHQLFLTHS